MTFFKKFEFRIEKIIFSRPPSPQSQQLIPDVKEFVIDQSESKVNDVANHSEKHEVEQRSDVDFDVKNDKIVNVN